MKIIRSIEDSYVSKKGWTYFLLSKNKRHVKIGHATPNLNRRVYQLLHNEYYKALGFEFHFAVLGEQYENRFHTLFDEFRARIKWVGKDSYYGMFFTEKESWKLAVLCYKKEFDNKYDKLGVLNYYRNNTQTTRNEIFNIPPVKVGKKLEFIVTSSLV